MKLLLHTCCGPCLLYPLKRLRDKGFDTTVFFFNPNIHPYREFRRRLDTLSAVTEDLAIPLIAERDYGLVEFTQAVVHREKQRCSICYDLRLEKTVEIALEKGFTHFSTTLLYSRYQNHQLIVEKCKCLAERNSIVFHYQDYRDGWQEGVDESIERSLYRQPYCGCLYSEQERYDNRLKKKLRKLKKEKRG